MKNVQVIDGADNCTYPIYSLTDDEFLIIFPSPGQNVEFIEDAIDRVGEEKLGLIMTAIWKRPVNKPEAIGIHGTLFYELISKKKYYPTKKDYEMVWGRSEQLP